MKSESDRIKAFVTSILDGVTGNLRLIASYLREPPKLWTDQGNILEPHDLAIRAQAILETVVICIGELSTDARLNAALARGLTRLEDCFSGIQAVFDEALASRRNDSAEPPSSPSNKPNSRKRTPPIRLEQKSREDLVKLIARGKDDLHDLAQLLSALESPPEVSGVEAEIREQHLNNPNPADKWVTSEMVSTIAKRSLSTVQRRWLKGLKADGKLGPRSVKVYRWGKVREHVFQIVKVELPENPFQD